MNTDEQLDLPWYVNNSLDTNRRQAIETQLSADTELKLEAEFLQHVRQQVKHPASASPGEFGWQRLKNQIQETQKPGHPRRWQGLAIAASVLLMIQGGVLFKLLQTDDSYAPLSGVTHSQPTIQIRFNPDVREADMRKLLLDIHGQILDGPSANGLYRVTLGDTSNDQIAQRIEQVRNSGLVQHVAQD
ncbi:MAG TPA: hypothetical protein VFY78_02345 [Gammaproteobacteria bacterium]|nr:hypothetical protein [Gammaproteobacteria bacterium]